VHTVAGVKPPPGQWGVQPTNVHPSGRVHTVAAVFGCGWQHCVCACVGSWLTGGGQTKQCVRGVGATLQMMHRLAGVGWQQCVGACDGSSLTGGGQTKQCVRGVGATLQIMHWLAGVGAGGH
jgi:cytochrome c biogenesis protein CcdA